MPEQLLHDWRVLCGLHRDEKREWSFFGRYADSILFQRQSVGIVRCDLFEAPQFRVAFDAVFCVIVVYGQQVLHVYEEVFAVGLLKQCQNLAIEGLLLAQDVVLHRLGGVEQHLGGAVCEPDCLHQVSGKVISIDAILGSIATTQDGATMPQQVVRVQFNEEGLVIGIFANYLKSLRLLRFFECIGYLAIHSLIYIVGRPVSIHALG